MTTENLVSIPVLPAPLHWHGVPKKWSVQEDSLLTFSAGERTDWFIDPGGTSAVLNAPALLFELKQIAMLKARVTVEHAATFDAGVLTIYRSDQVWAKLCLELSPQGQPMIVSVVTRGNSDDCNSVIINGNSIYMRVARLEKAFAFHYSQDGKAWNLVRHFALSAPGKQEIEGKQPERVELGFLVQSPTGNGCTASFSEIAYLPERLRDIRSGE